MAKKEGFKGAENINWEDIFSNSFQSAFFFSPKFSKILKVSKWFLLQKMNRYFPWYTPISYINLPDFLGMCTMDPKGTLGKTFALPRFRCGPTGKEALPIKLTSTLGIREVSGWSVFPWIRFIILM